MELEFRRKDSIIGQSAYDHITGCIEAALSRFAHRINRVTIWLVDNRGSHRGIDKKCRITVQMSKGRIIRTENRNTSLVAAVYFAVDKAAYAICRELNRCRRRKRKMRFFGINDE